jgi:ABC-type phosphate transport system ATPase subunit
MSIYDNVAYGMRIHQMKKGRDLDQAVQHYLEAAGLWKEVKDRLHQPAARLSLGQQQRLCLARGLAVEPEILLGDEATSALDPISAQHIEQRLIDLKEKIHRAMVTYIPRQARCLAISGSSCTRARWKPEKRSRSLKTPEERTRATEGKNWAEHRLISLHLGSMLPVAG